MLRPALMRTTSRLAFAIVSIALTAGCDPAPAPSTSCDQLGDACHDASGAGGLAAECHDIGHDGDVAACDAMLTACLAACAAPGDAGTDAPTVGDAGTPDAGTDAPTDVPVALRFEARVGDAPFACGETYMLGTPAREATPRDFRFYVHDVRLLTAAGAEVAVTLDEDSYQGEEVALLDFEDGTGGCDAGDAATNADVTGTAPPGTYTGVVFRLGVPFELNHSDVATAPVPMNVSTLYWAWNIGRLFLAAETVTDVEGDPITHTTHVGSTMCMGDPALGTPVTGCARENRTEIRLEGLDPSTGAIVVDFAAIKAEVDVGTDTSCHSFQPTCTEPFASLGLSWATGEPDGEQSVFSVE